MICYHCVQCCILVIYFCWVSRYVSCNRQINNAILNYAGFVCVWERFSVCVCVCVVRDRERRNVCVCMHDYKMVTCSIHYTIITRVRQAQRFTKLQFNSQTILKRKIIFVYTWILVKNSRITHQATQLHTHTHIYSKIFDNIKLIVQNIFLKMWQNHYFWPTAVLKDILGASLKARIEHMWSQHTRQDTLWEQTSTSSQWHTCKHEFNIMDHVRHEWRTINEAHSYIHTTSMSTMPNTIHSIIFYNIL